MKHSERNEFSSSIPDTIIHDGREFHVVDLDGLRCVYQEDWYNPDTDKFDLDEPHCYWEVRWRTTDEPKLYYVWSCDASTPLRLAIKFMLQAVTNE